MTTARLSPAMQTTIDRAPWQNLPEMARDLSAELAGVSAAFDLLAIWNFHGARNASERVRKARGQRLTTDAAARIRDGMKAAGIAAETRRALADHVKGGAA